MAAVTETVLSSKNECGKRRDVSHPYEVWEIVGQGWEWRVLKKYQSPKGESKNPYARWHCAVKSPWVDGYERGDVYIHEIRGSGAIQKSI